MVEFFIDSSDIKEIKEMASWNIISGVTTNPKILSSDKVENIEERIKEIADVVDGPISVEVFSEDVEEMIAEAKKYSKWHPNVIIKVPMLGGDSLKTMKELNSRNIKINATACMSSNQAVAAALAGADYISFFYGRIGDCGYDPFIVIKETAEVFKNSPKLKKTKIIIGSMRSVLDVNRSIMAGADIITITPPILRRLVVNAKTTETIKEFEDSWKKFKEEEIDQLTKRIEQLKS